MLFLCPTLPAFRAIESLSGPLLQLLIGGFAFAAFRAVHTLGLREWHGLAACASMVVVYPMFAVST